MSVHQSAAHKLEEQDQIDYSGYIKAVNNTIDTALNYCITTKNLITSVKKVDLFPTITSAEERRQLNQTERSIPDIRADLQKLRELTAQNNFTYDMMKQIDEKLQPLTAALENINVYAKSLGARYPKAKPGLLFWLVSPQSIIFHHFVMANTKVKGIIAKIKLARTKKTLQSIRERRAELEKDHQQHKDVL